LISASPESDAQYNFAQNPFLKEENFFLTSYEKKVFEDYLSGKPTNSISLFLAINQNASDESAKDIQGKVDQLHSLLAEKKHRHTTDLSFLYKIFTLIQTRHLVKYEKFTTLQSLLGDGTYDCLTATALYGLTLKKFKYDIDIKETACHSYLTVNIEGKKILFESTDREDGFLNVQNEVKSRELKYAMQARPGDENLSGLSGDVSLKSGFATYSKSIDIVQLAGLQYYNQGVAAHDNKMYRIAVRMLEKAYMIYPCKRVFTLLISSVHEVLRTPDITDKEIKRYSAKTKYYTMNSGDW
jgi:hypothetical protein